MHQIEDYQTFVHSELRIYQEWWHMKDTRTGGCHKFETSVVYTASAELARAT